ncbi:MAG: alpha/beta hydrolase, partial [Proteobacteria bacterium]|nr:alpha/beta hydrolase [Pseudomonadota bacterium]
GIGNPESIVLIHGLGDQAAHIWQSLTPELEKNYHVVAFDLPGFGRSEKKNALYSPANYTSFISWVVERYTTGKVIILGHSMGGAITLHYASHYPEKVKLLILADVAGILHRLVITEFMSRLEQNKKWPNPLKRSLELPMNALNRLTSEIIKDLENEDPSVYMELVLNNSLMRKLILKGNPSTIAGLATVEEDFSALFKKVKVPSLILWGEDDNVAPLRTGKLLAARLPSTQFEVIQNAGHVPMSQNKREFNRLVLNALSSGIKPNGVMPSKIKGGDRVGRCSNESNIIFSGAYEKIEVTNCRNVSIENASVKFIKVSGSSVSIENSLIKGGDVALIVNNSNLTVTAVNIEAETAIKASKSWLDMAGVRIVGLKSALLADEESTVLFSVSQIKSPFLSRYIHGLFHIKPEQTF